MESAPCPFLLLWCTQSTLLHVLFSSLFIIQLKIFFCGMGVSLSRGLAGLSQGWLWEYCMPLICLPVGLHLSNRFGASIWWHGRPPGFQCYISWRSFVKAWGLGCQGFISSWWFFSAKSGSSISVRFLIYGPHAICFLPLVTIWDPPLF
jgi:hypothetical protein